MATGKRESSFLVPCHQIVHPVVVGASDGGAERTRRQSEKGDPGREDELLIEALRGAQLHSLRHVVARDLPARDIAAHPV